MVAQHKLIGFGLDRRGLNLSIAPYQTIGDAAGHIADYAALQDDAVFDLALRDSDIMIDRGEGADIAVDQFGALANDRRAAHHAVDNLCARLNDDDAVQVRVSI